MTLPLLNFLEANAPYLYVALGVEQEVLRLQISVDDTAAVQIVDGVDDAGDVEPGGEVVEPAPVPEDGPQLPAQTRLHQEVHVPATFIAFYCDLCD